MLELNLSTEGGKLEITRLRQIETPIQGPGQANTLLILTGIANLDASPQITGDLHLMHDEAGPVTEVMVNIITNYDLLEHSQTYLNIINGNTALLCATYVTLSYTDAEYEFALFVDSISTDINPDDHRIQIHCLLRWNESAVNLGVDMIRVTYQTNALLHTARRR
jgi:hypothetical protein